MVKIYYNILCKNVSKLKKYTITTNSVVKRANHLRTLFTRCPILQRDEVHIQKTSGICLRTEVLRSTFAFEKNPTCAIPLRL